MAATPFLNDFLKLLSEELTTALPEIKEQILNSTRDALLENMSRIDDWTAMASTGSLTQDDLKWLVSAQLDLSQLSVLEQSGLSLVRIDELRQTITRTFVTSLAAGIGL